MRELWRHLEETQAFYAAVSYLRCQHTIPNDSGALGADMLVCELIEGTGHDHLMYDDIVGVVYCWKTP